MYCAHLWWNFKKGTMRKFAISYHNLLKRVIGLSKYESPVAQLVERWTPGSESPGSRRSGARYMKLLTGMARLVGATAAS